jgi:hypothetical protein
VPAWIWERVRQAAAGLLDEDEWECLAQGIRESGSRYEPMLARRPCTVDLVGGLSLHTEWLGCELVVEIKHSGSLVQVRRLRFDDIAEQFEHARPLPLHEHGTDECNQCYVNGIARAAAFLDDVAFRSGIFHEAGVGALGAVLEVLHKLAAELRDLAQSEVRP